MSRRNVEIVRGAYEAWNRGDFEAAAQSLAPEVEWRLPGNFPEAGSWRGRDSVVDGLGELRDAWEELGIEVKQVLDAGDRVVALVRFHGRAAITGLDLEGVSVDAHVWTIRDGRAVEVQMHNGAADALQELGLSEQ